MRINNTSIRETAVLLIGEIAVSALVIGGYAIAKFGLHQDVDMLSGILGALLGTLVTVLNFFFLSISVNRAVDKYMELRGSREMTEEEAAQFTTAHSMEIQNTIKTSFIIRTVTMLVALVLAFISDWFSPLATAIPLLAFRPILTVGELVRKKRDKAPDPNKYVRYGNDEAKEDDDR